MSFLIIFRLSLKLNDSNHVFQITHSSSLILRLELDVVLGSGQGGEKIGLRFWLELSSSLCPNCLWYTLFIKWKESISTPFLVEVDRAFLGPKPDNSFFLSPFHFNGPATCPFIIIFLVYYYFFSSFSCCFYSLT